MAAFGATGGPESVWRYRRAIGSDLTQLVLHRVHIHSILSIEEYGVVQVASQWRPAPGHSWQSPPCSISSTGMCLDRKTTNLAHPLFRPCRMMGR